MNAPPTSAMRVSHITRRRLLAVSAAMTTALVVRHPVVAAARLDDDATTAGDDFATLVDIGGRDLWLDSRGIGGPTVVLEAGAGNNGEIWDTAALPAGETTTAVLPGVAAFSGVCAYDRPNTYLDPDHPSRSTPNDTPVDAGGMVADLRALLRAAPVAGPYVLVGHSFGGLVVRLYASLYPDDVAGLVLVDAAHEDYEPRLRELLTPSQQALLLQPSDSDEYPNLEQIDVPASAERMRVAATTAPLRPLPLVVITHGRPWDWPADVDVDAIEAMWNDLQAELVGLVPHGRLVVAHKSQHYIQLAEPQVVIDAVRQVVDAVRDPSTWTT